MHPLPIPRPCAPRRTPPARARRVLALGLLLTMAACGNGGGGNPPRASSTAATSATMSPGTTTAPGASPTVTGPTGPTPVPPPGRTGTAPPARTCVEKTAEAMTDAQKVGQLIMAPVRTTGMTDAEATALTRGKVGSVILMNHTAAGTAAVAGVTARVRSFAPSVNGARIGMLVSTDQEGGQVQVLNGPGFSPMPPAVVQGRWSTAVLQASAATWARQLKAAGVNMNLAPVADTVPPGLTDLNAPIGKLQREYGDNPAVVSSHATAFLRGMLQTGVLPVAKHFPGLGRVRGNTDLAANVRDTVTTRDDPYLQPFRSAVQAGTPFVMISSAIYTRIDAGRQAAFSPVVIQDMLRGSLHFTGVVISDDLGRAVAVSDRTPGRRALDFLSAGGDMVLTVQSQDVVPMTSAVLARLPHDAHLRKNVEASVRRVLTAKRAAGLLSCG